jgi:hypothetical protein
MSDLLAVVKKFSMNVSPKARPMPGYSGGKHDINVANLVIPAAIEHEGSEGRTALTVTGAGWD